MDSRYIAYGLGKQAALTKVALNPLITRALVGAGIGAGTGALTAGEGNRGTGALVGGALGGLGGMLRGSGGAAEGRAMAYGSQLGPRNQARLYRAAYDNPQALLHGVHGLAGASGGALAGLGGGLATRALTPKEPTWQEKLKGMVGMD